MVKARLTAQHYPGDMRRTLASARREPVGRSPARTLRNSFVEVVRELLKQHLPRDFTRWVGMVDVVPCAQDGLSMLDEGPERAALWLFKDDTDFAPILLGYVELSGRELHIAARQGPEHAIDLVRQRISNILPTSLGALQLFPSEDWI